MKRLRLLIVCFVIIAALLPTMPVYADTANPDSTPTVDVINWYRNLLETGDRIVVWQANIPYASVPSTLVTETFYWELIDTDNVTVLGSTTGFAYNDDGYGYNVYSMYFSAADSLTWGQTYTLRLSGNPAVFDTPPQYNYPINVTDYTSLTATADNQAALASWILLAANDLDIRWGLTVSTSLIIATESGTALSIYGETVFRGSIFGCQALAPAAFRFIVEDLDAPARTWNPNYTSNLTAMYTGTWIAPAKVAGGTLFGVGFDLFSIILVIGSCIGLYYLNTKITNDQWNAWMDISILLIAAPRIDLFPLTFTALLGAFAAMYTGTRVKSFIR